MSCSDGYIDFIIRYLYDYLLGPYGITDTEPDSDTQHDRINHCYRKDRCH